MTESFQRPKEMAKAYEPTLVEERLYQWWDGKGLFQPSQNTDKTPFVVAMPPPNVTGELHMGHAMFVTLEDVMTRWQRMCGHPALWIPGTDHAGIATQLQVERALVREGTSRAAVGRVAFEKRTWEWKEEFGGKITQQLRRIGASCDWSREHFTLDPDLSRAVRTAFKKLYDDGLIYRGTRLVNWSPNLQTAVSDLEVEYEDRDVHMWHIRYPIAGDWTPGAWASGSWAAGATQYITVATTRPETLMGDVAVAVNPTDERYAHLIGQFLVLPVVNRRIPIVADEHADPTFGTGAVKITPAHDHNDYAVAQRQNLPMINILNRDATLNSEAGPYNGTERFAARKAVLADLEKEQLLVATLPHRMSVGISQRGGEVIEPLLSEQWFVKMQPLADMALAAVKSGETKIIPENFGRVYDNWLDNIQDWCISRQLWWGHRIPVWYGPNGEMIVPGPDEPDPTGPGITQDPDVLDTWFSSGLWPFSTLGWPDNTPDFQRFYPTQVMETGYDILFFWVARMMMLGCYLTGKAPFHTIYLHGLVRDKDGRKMSKTYGNVVNPLDIMSQFGTDALRFTLATSSSPGQDLNLNPERIESGRNFANKLWNITRFVLGRFGDWKPNSTHIVTGSCLLNYPYTVADRWIMSRYQQVVADVDRLMTGYNYGEAGRQIQDFIWNEFADWYVEIAKGQLDGDEGRQLLTREVLFTVLEGSLRLLHPFMPFVTEEAWQYLTGRVDQDTQADSLMVAAYPQPDASLRDIQAEQIISTLREIVIGIRNVRSEYKVEPAKFVAATIVSANAAQLDEQRLLLARMARLNNDELSIVDSIPARPKAAATLVIGDIEVFIPLAGLIDLDAERQRLTKDLESAVADAERKRTRLGDESFTGKAPAAVVQKERDFLTNLEAQIARLTQRLHEYAAD
ncbi:MAG: valine--tRNA ligase [Roseiflexaceae bacterium]